MSNAVSRTKYLTALAGIGRAYEGARKTLVMAYWQIGRYIVELEQDGEVHAQYGAGLLKKLSHDLSAKYGAGFSVTNLERMRLLYVQNPKSATLQILPWSQRIALLRVQDPLRRKALEKKAVREGLGARELREIVSAEVKTEDSLRPAAPASVAPLKRPGNLELATYKKAGDFIDCGFYVLYPLAKEDAAGVTLRAKPSYTYAATVERVVDGDTLWAFIELGFGIRVREKLRLAGIDTPELGTPEGERARKFVCGLLPPGAMIVIHSSKDDKYGRFVADVFCETGTASADEIISYGIYLNQELLVRGLAQRMG